MVEFLFLSFHLLIPILYSTYYSDNNCLDSLSLLAFYCFYCDPLLIILFIGFNNYLAFHNSVYCSQSQLPALSSQLGMAYKTSTRDLESNNY